MQHAMQFISEENQEEEDDEEQESHISELAKDFFL